ncbi:helix-turn-helix domain-containing protein [Mycobacteroides abscessus]|uniref:helix-turn-helix domain-containing protein n=1 Tax=Mycobacteroides abscessus TaxID=36809 RepID=UPI00092A1D8B|nr:helix-turn-helix domain-containing protein [Mycobacteroides abscessus]SIJ94253.1 DNA binding domain, excisionase family [Mycobacteroides abscessus subsp. abscessus]
MTETTKVDVAHIAWDEIATATAHHDEDPLYTAQEFADELRVSLRTALDLLRGGALPATKVGGQWRVTRSAIDKFLNRQRRGPEVVSIAYKNPDEDRFVVVGPTGSGKGLIAADLRKRHPHAHIEEVQVHSGAAGPMPHGVLA